MKTETHPSAWGFLAGAFILILGLFINASCAHAHAPPRPGAPLTLVAPARTLAQRAATAVAVYTECGSGSGVLIDGTHVLTAYHVVDCGSGDKPQPAQAIVIRTAASFASIAMIEVGDPSRDIARLILRSPVEGVPPVRIRHALVGDRACAATSVPERAFRCGTITGFEEPRAFGDATVGGMNVWYGNSGSGAYADDGSLIGITVRLKWCSPGDGLFVALTDTRIDTCGGRLSSITDSPVMM